MKTYAKSEKAYKRIEFDTKAIKSAYAKRKKKKPQPTSVSLPEAVIAELKDIAQIRGLPYQTLIGSLIIEGLERLRK